MPTRPRRGFARQAARLGILAACVLVTALVVPARAPAAPLWAGTGSLAVARGHHTATLLPGGKVLVSGGRITDFTSTQSAELYDPSVGAWAAAGALATPRAFHTETLLSNGKVLVTGGLGGANPSATTEVFDPAAGSGGSWTPGPTLTDARSRHTATRLADGRVLVAGGLDSAGTPLASVEIFDPAASGGAGTPLASVEIFDPSASGGAGAWTAGPSLAEARARHTATLLPDGKVLLVGGTTCAPPSPVEVACPTVSTELFDPSANAGAGGWSSGAPMGGARFDHVATRLVNGKVLVAGGQDAVGSIQRSSELFDPAENPGPLTWSDATPMSVARTDFSSALLADGRVLVAGGGTGNTVDVGSAEIWNPATGLWTATASLLQARHGHTLTSLSSAGCSPRCGQVLLAGGIRRLPSDYLASAELYDPIGPAARPLAPSPDPTLPPGAVRDLAARARSTSRIVLAFSAPGRPPATAYVVKQSTRRIVGENGFAGARSLCGGTCRFTPRSPGERLTLTVRGLRPKRTYYYALRALGPGGHPGPLSNVARARTRFRRPGRVRGVRARALSPTRIRLSFRATGAPTARSYVVKQSSAPITSSRRFRRAHSLCGGACRFRPRDSGERISLLVRGLRPGARYCYAVRARDGRRLAARSRSFCVKTKRASRGP